MRSVHADILTTVDSARTGEKSFLTRSRVYTYDTNDSPDAD